MPTDEQFNALLGRIADLERRVTELEHADAPTTVVLRGFDSFWQAYPRKVCKLAATRAWAKLKAHDREAATKAVALFGSIWANAPADRLQYCPHAGSWLNNRRWEDGEQEWRRSAGITTQKPLPGAHTQPATTVRQVEVDSPEWVRRTHAALVSDLRPEIPDTLWEQYLTWTKGGDARPPADWRIDLQQAWDVARELAR
jgi:hypothetical protein